MTMTVQDLLDHAGIEAIYPGQRIVKPFKVNGEYKSHCMVLNWRDPSKLRIEVKAGLTGRDLPPNELRKYPVSLQAPTYFEFDVHNNGTNKTKLSGSGAFGQSH